jgi:hypothetical protein
MNTQLGKPFGKNTHERIAKEIVQYKRKRSWSLKRQNEHVERLDYWHWLWPLFARSAWAQPATVVAGTTRESAARASVHSVGVGPASHCGGGHDRWGRCFCQWSPGRRGIREHLWRRSHQVRALLWPLFPRAACAQPATVEAGTTCQGAALAFVSWVFVGSASHCGGGHHSWGRFSGLWSLGRRGFNQPQWWWALQVRALVWPLFASSAWVQPATVVANTKGEGDALASVRLVGVGSASHCGGEREKWDRCYGLYSLDRRGHSQPLWWQARQARALFWPLFARTAWSHPATVVADTTGEGAALASVRFVGVGPGSHCGGGHDKWGRCSGLCSVGRHGLR